MIQYRIIPSNKLKRDMFAGYIRHQETTRVKYIENGTIQEKDDYFIDDWDNQKLESVVQDIKNVDGINIFAFDKKKVVGFTNIDINSFNGYMNMPFIHVDKNHRGNSIGKNLVLYASKLILDKGIDKMYVSAHPSVETYSFYESMGFELASYINQEILSHEPLDLQLERKLDYTDVIYRKIEDEFKKEKRLSAKTLMSILPRVYKFMPKNVEDYITVCRNLLKEDKRYHYSIATLLLKKRTDAIDELYLDLYEDTLINDINGWGQVDQYCYRVLGPIFNQNYKLYPTLLKWSDSKNKDVRRAALVSMLQSSGKITCIYPLQHILELCEKLKEDEDFHVRKAVGWILKCAYVTYPIEIKDYLVANVTNLDRMIFRYALEHVDKRTKEELMNL